MTTSSIPNDLAAMMNIAVKSNLIILRGVYPADFARRQPLTRPVPKVEVSIYTSLPDIFDGPENWPHHSNLRCWNCTLLFRGRPKFAPRFPSGKDTNFRCTAVGNMCSWACAARYVLDKFPRNEQIDALDLICLIEAMFTGKPRRFRIQPAPDKTIRAEYCGIGGMSSAEYVEAVAEIEQSMTIEDRFDDWRP